MSLHHMLRAAAGYQAPAPANTDPQFNYVSLLLHGDGTNGAQNNTFLDSSSNNFTITRNGNTTQGSLSPYGNLWSNFFAGGSSDYLTAANNNAFNLDSGDYTVEFWFNTSSVTTTYSLLGPWSFPSGWLFQQVNNTINFYGNGGNISGYHTSGPILNANQWTHVAVTRSGSTSRMFVNGTLVSSTSVSINTSSNVLGIGVNPQGFSQSFRGYLSDVRIVKGTAVYTSNFTPPTAPLTAISGTSLLTCQSNRFIDNSANNFTITVAGDVQVTKEAPFLPTAAYSTSVIGGSGYFDGTGDYLNTPSNAAFSFGTGDFTVELWAYCTQDLTSGTTQFSLYSSEALNSSGSFGLFFLGGTWYVRINGLGNDLTAAASASQRNTWVHFAVCRNAGTMTFYINGAAVASGNRSTQSVTQTQAYLGFLNGFTGYDFAGYMSNVRVVKGTAVYTAAFTPPTAPLTAITNTSLLLNFTNAGIFDNAAENDLETVGNAQISTSVKKYGTGSLAFDGNADWLVAQAGQNLNLSTGNFTVEGWVYATSNSDGVVFAISDGNPIGSASQLTCAAFFSGGSLVGRVYNSTFNTVGTASVSTGTWTHFALVRNGNVVTFYVNGTSTGTYSTTGALNYGSNWKLGVGSIVNDSSTGYLNGYVDDFRITKGFARYTANFTPPTAAFPDQ